MQGRGKKICYVSSIHSIRLFRERVSYKKISFLSFLIVLYAYPNMYYFKISLEKESRQAFCILEVYFTMTIFLFYSIDSLIC